MSVRSSSSVIYATFLAVAVLFCPRSPAAEKGADSTASTERGTTVYVSKLGDDSDGSSWAKAFHSVQRALAAIPNNRGGHRVIVRPDTYQEANLYPAHQGAEGAYNELVGDVDGRLGSGATGWVIIDSGDATRGFQSYDWHSTIRAYKKGWSKEHKAESFSAVVWDRWSLRHLYCTGSDGGWFFDLVDQVVPFSVVVEDCVGIGRAFGGGVANCLSCPNEPVVFRRCTLWSLDFWGDTSGAYVRFENKQMPKKHDILFEDCTLVGPQCAFKSSNFGFHTYTHARLSGCRLVALNFSQPHGTPTDGVIQSVQNGELLSIDLENCTIMGYKVFGVIVDKDSVDKIAYTCRGEVKAYVQFQQQVPEGMQRLTAWPVEVFQQIAPRSK